MLKAVIIGSQGHSYYAFDGISLGAPCVLTASAPGPSGGLDDSVSQKCGHVYESYVKMLEDEKPDIAVINPRFDEISVCAQKALEIGINIFCEKPLAVTWEGIKNVESAAGKTDARICAMMGMRHFSTFMALKKAIDSGTLGDIRLIHAQKSYKLGKRDDFYKCRATYGGTIPWIGSHPLDMIYWLSGRKRFTKIFASHTSLDNKNHGELESCAGMALKSEGGIISTVNIDYLRPSDAVTHGDDRIRVVGSDGWAEIRGGKFYIEDIEQETGFDGNIFKDFCMELCGKENCSISNEDSLYITKICLAARDSADMGKLIEIGDTI